MDLFKDVKEEGGVVRELTLCANGVTLRLGQVWELARDVGSRKITRLCLKSGSCTSSSDSPHAHTSTGYHYLTRWQDGTFSKLVEDPSLTLRGGAAAGIKVGDQLDYDPGRAGRIMTVSEVFLDGCSDRHHDRHRAHVHFTEGFAAWDSTDSALRHLVRADAPAAAAKAADVVTAPTSPKRREVSPDGGRSWVDYDSMSDPDPFDAYPVRRLGGAVVAEKKAARAQGRCADSAAGTGACYGPAIHLVGEENSVLCTGHYLGYEASLVPRVAGPKPERLAPGVRPGQPFSSHALAAGGVINIRSR